VEYTEGEDNANDQKLTSILHWRDESASITVDDLDTVYNAICHGTGKSNGLAGKTVCDLILEQADVCVTAPISANFENKIVLAIAIRMLAERFMVKKINDPPFVAAIAENQSHKLATKFKQKFPGDASAIEILDQVLLMTPENLHLNSFMYEPTVDMSDERLRVLYGKVKSLCDRWGP
jgi:hypothetical protein